jgi:hypothetical protein
MSRPPERMTPQRAAKFRIPYGKYRNVTIREIGERDPGYLRYLGRE